MTAPTVSVVMACYNGEAYLTEAVESVLGQTLGDVQLVVVDDGSTDASAALLEAYGDRLERVRQRNRGQAAARNVGISRCRGTYLAFLDADDYWDPAFLQRMVGAIRSSGAGLAYCGWQNVGVSGGRGRPFVPPDYALDQDLEATLLRNTRWPIHAAVVRRDLVTAAGGFDETLTSCEDFALWLRVAATTALVRVPEVLAYYRHHDRPQLTDRRAAIALDHWRAQRRFVAARPATVARLGPKRLRELTHGELLARGYACYWDRDLPAARRIFRRVMGAGYGRPRDWLYMLPSLLPLSLHRALLAGIDRRRAGAR